MKCEDCTNYKKSNPVVSHKTIVSADNCQNFKPKQHPLDEIISNVPLNSTLKATMEKLRYESIKWAVSQKWLFINKNIDDKEIHRFLEGCDRKDWIVE